MIEPGPNTASPSLGRCVECLEPFQRAELMDFSGAWVCRKCKPGAVDKITRGLPLGRLWRRRNRLVIVANAPLPDRCVRCNSPAEGFQVRRRFFWHHPAFYVLVPTLLFYFVVAGMFQRSATVAIPLCPLHRAKRTRGFLAGSAIFVAGLLPGLIPMVTTGPRGDWIVFLSFIVPALCTTASVLVASYFLRILDVTRITATHAFLKRVGEPFLAELPEWRGE